MPFLIEFEATVRLIFFLALLAMMALWESRLPRRQLQVKRSTRWINNLALSAINTAITRLLFPAATIATAYFTLANNYGLFQWIKIPPILNIFLTVLLFDFVIYFQHRMFHRIPLFWRLHRVHHADLDYDVTTAARFHPIEIVLSLFIKLFIILIIGPEVVAVVIFEILLNSTAMFNHGNVRLSNSVDRIFRFIIVTPDMHRVHHSCNHVELNHNFGFNFPYWDRLFGTYKAKPHLPHDQMKIGLSELRDPKQVVNLLGLLKMPFK